MVAIGMVLLVGGYGLGLMGYSLIRGYDMSPGSIWNPVHVGKWNTSVYTGPSVFPDGKTQQAPSSTKPTKPAKPAPNAGSVPGTR